MVVVGETVEKAIWRAKELENVCEQYWRALQIREPDLLPMDEMERIVKVFEGYGGQKKLPEEALRVLG